MIEGMQVIAWGLRVTLVWLLVCLATGLGGLLSRWKQEFKQVLETKKKRLLITAGLLIFGIFVFGVSCIMAELLFAPSFRFEESLYYVPVSLALLAFTFVMLVASLIWLILLIRREGICPSESLKQWKLILPGGVFFILLVTLLRVLFLWFRQ